MDVPANTVVRLSPHKHYSSDPKPDSYYSIDVTVYDREGNSRRSMFHVAPSWQRAITWLCDAVLAEPDLF